MVGKSIIQVAGVALCLAVLIGCGESGTESQQPVLTFLQSGCLDHSTSAARQAVNGGQDPYIVGVESSECLGGLAKTFADVAGPGGTVRFAVAHDTVFVYHDSAYYNCCVGFDYTIECNGAFLDFIEADTGMQCDCMCYFNLQTSAAGVAPGTYTARLWTDDRTELLGQAEITVVGAGTVWFETRCDTLLVYNNAYHTNCGALFVFDFSQQGAVLTFTQVDTSSMWMHCVCDFDLSAQVTGLANGDYTVRLWDGGNSHNMGGEVDSLITEATVNISCP